jgi:hypothetical protein
MKIKALFIIGLLSVSLGCAQLSGPASDFADKVGSTADTVANDSAAMFGKAMELDLPGLIKSAGEAVANLIKGVAEIVASPVESAQDIVADTVVPAEE